MYNLLSLFLLYLNIVFTFSLIYLLLDWNRWGMIVDHYATDIQQNSWLERITRSVYFSAITLFSVGYGDITPFGWSRAVAVIEACMGYILPAVIVIKYAITPAHSVYRLLVAKKEKKSR